MPRDYDVLPRKAVEESAFHVELEWEVPWDFWEETPEPSYEDPEQLRIFEIEPPEPVDFLDALDDEFGRRGWPSQATQAVYSYFEGPVDNPREGEEEEDPFLLPLMRFWVWIPGDWLIEHPDFFRQFDELARDGVRIPPDSDQAYRLVYWRIYADRGLYEGTAWENSYFIVRKTSEQVERLRAEKRERKERIERIRRGGWPRPVEWSPRGKLPGEA